MLRSFLVELNPQDVAPMHLLLGDITRLTVDAIVNAANPTLLGGGGVDGAIHRSAGPKLLAACKLLGGCETGQAKATAAFDLSSKFIFHTVGPVWSGGAGGEAEKLASCYRSCLELAVDRKAQSIAFPSISTGVYRYPIEQASSIAVRSCADFLRDAAHRPEIYFVCYERSDWEIYHAALQSLVR